MKWPSIDSMEATSSRRDSDNWSLLLITSIGIHGNNDHDAEKAPEAEPKGGVDDEVRRTGYDIDEGILDATDFVAYCLHDRLLIGIRMGLSYPLNAGHSDNQTTYPQSGQQTFNQFASIIKLLLCHCIFPNNVVT